jgi:hypothetical protein
MVLMMLSLSVGLGHLESSEAPDISLVVHDLESLEAEDRVLADYVPQGCV